MDVRYRKRRFGRVRIRQRRSRHNVDPGTNPLDPVDIFDISDEEVEVGSANDKPATG